MWFQNVKSQDQTMSLSKVLGINENNLPPRPNFSLYYYNRSLLKQCARLDSCPVWKVLCFKLSSDKKERLIFISCSLHCIKASSKWYCDVLHYMRGLLCCFVNYGVLAFCIFLPVIGGFVFGVAINSGWGSIWIKWKTVPPGLCFFYLNVEGFVHFCMYKSNMCLCDITKPAGHSLRLKRLPDSSILIDSTLYLSSSTSMEHVFVSSRETGQSERLKLLRCEIVQCMPGWGELLFTAAA